MDSSATVAANAQLDTVVALAIDAPTLSGVTGVGQGSTIRSIYLRLEAASNEAIDLGAIPNFYMYVFKNPGGNLVEPSPNAVGSSDNKKFVLHQEMVMLENKGQGSNPRLIFQGVVKLPKMYQRFGYNDSLIVSTKCPALDTAQCMQVIYQELR